MAQITILDQANVPQGPFTREEVAQKLAAGEFTLQSLAFVEGLTQWTPLGAVLVKVDAGAPPPPATLPPTVTTSPGAAPSTYFYAATMQPPEHLVYAGFWLRFVAYLIDSFILGAVIMAFLFLFGFVIGLFGMMSGANLQGMSGFHPGEYGSRVGEAAPNPVFVGIVAIFELVIWVVMLVVSWLYFAKLESGPHQATLGKRALGLRVTDLTGQRVGFGRASGRFFGKIVSAIPLDLGFIMAAFTERKQALHDMMAGTLVVKQ